MQWQWQANPKEGWAFPTVSGFLRMFSVFQPDSEKNLWNYPAILTQKFPAEEFTATIKFDFKPRHENERFGLIVFGTDYAFISLQKKKSAVSLTFNHNLNADKNSVENESIILEAGSKIVYLKVSVSKNAVCSFSFSENGENFTSIDQKFTAKPGKWVGAKIGMFFTRDNLTNDAGYTDIDWFRINKPD